MKIAIVAPSPVPFRIGGAERLWWRLTAYLNDATRHEAELVKLPSPEGNLAALLTSYEAFTRLDLSAFDLVISGKYPAWMVAHPRHVCYMLHRLRGLYDAYDGAGSLPTEAAREPHVQALRSYMVRTAGQRGALGGFFERVRETLAHAGHLPGVRDFPGPFAREVVHWLDGVGLAPSAIERFAAISRTVAERAAYFPPEAQVDVLWPPPATTARTATGSSYFFTASRLDAPKRIDLVIDAMRRVQGDMTLIIAGDGPDRARLEARAAFDERIRFAGWQGDAELDSLYAGARAVVFVPCAEDYGLVTAEAMQAGKPVITTTDAGGPRELVVHGENGFVCAPDPGALADAMRALAADPALAERLGEAARLRVAGVQWSSVVEGLVGDPLTIVRAPPAARKLVVATTFPIDPPRHGGQSRVIHLYSSLSPAYATTVVSFGPAGTDGFDREIAPGVREIRVPRSSAHAAREALLQRDAGIPIADVVMPELHALTPEFAVTLAREAASAHAVVACHPYLYPALAGLGRPVWYEAQDLEWNLKRDVLGTTVTGRRLLEGVQAVEAACARGAAVVLCTSAHDRDELVRQYGVALPRIVVAPNGTDCSRIAYADAAARAALKERLGLAGRRFALFMGSGHWPNIEALRHVAQWARAMPDVTFVALGSVCAGYAPPVHPANLLYLGEVDDITRDLMLELADVALNPVEHGSGTNLKMLDYFAAGAPVLSTPTGARGTGVRDGRECRIVAIDAFPAALRDMLAADAGEHDAMTRAARDHVEANFDWAGIGGAVLAALRSEDSPNADQPALR